MCIPSLVSEWLLGEVGCKEISPADFHDHPKGGDADLSANTCQLLVEQNGNGVKVAPIET